MKEEHNNEIQLKEENTILGFVDAHAKSGGLSHATDTDDGHDYDALFALLSATRSSLKPDAALLRKTLTKLPTAAAGHLSPLAAGEAVPSPYSGGTTNRLYARVSSWRIATPVIVLFLAIAAIIGVAPKKGQAPTVSLVNQEFAVPVSLPTAEPSTFAEAPASKAAPNMMISKMSLSTVPSTTPQNVGELIALLSNEADGDVGLGVSDVNDPLYSVDVASVDALQQSYDTQTI